MDRIEELFSEHETLKREQKHRRLDSHMDDKSFYAMHTEIAVAKRLQEIRDEIGTLYKNQKKTK